MATLEQIEILMSGVGPVLDALEVAALPERKSWAVALEEDLAVLVQFDEQKNSLVLTGDVGAPPAGDRTALYEILLQMNYHWEATAGLRMAIDGPGGEVTQMFEIPADGLDAGRLSGILASFASAAKAWRGIVERPASAQSSTLDLQANLGMRV